jgi:hypothetical protein
MAWFYSQKAEAALMTLHYKYSNDIKDLEGAAAKLDESIKSYTNLTKLTSATYLYANSMQTSQRKIPMRGVDGTYKHWKEMMPVFEKELKVFRHKIDSLKNNAGKIAVAVKPFNNAAVQTAINSISLENGVTLFSDTSLVIKNIADELKGLKAAVLPFRQMQKDATGISFTAEKPIKILVGFFKTQRGAFTTDTIFLKAPELETNASADDYGQGEIKISNAIAIEGMPPVNVHVYNFKAGQHTLKLEKGVCLILGFVDGDTVIPVYDAGLMSDLRSKSIDWLFE